MKYYVCDKKGHFSYWCPNKKDFDSEEEESSNYSSKKNKKKKNKGKKKSISKEKAYSVFTF